jgi:hypothetical protein
MTPISTGPANFSYEVIDTIFAIDASSAGFIAGVDPGKAFDGVKNKLRDKYRNALGNGMFGPKQILEIFAYGTAIKRK